LDTTTGAWLDVTGNWEDAAKMLELERFLLALQLEKLVVRDVPAEKDLTKWE
jgi:hypothetical protein